MPLGLSQGLAGAVEHQADVVQRAAPDLQAAVFHARLRQDDGACHQGDAVVARQVAEQLLVVVRHRLRLGAQQRIAHARRGLGGEQGAEKVQRVAGRQPMQGLALSGGVIELVLLAHCQQPGADVFGQHDHRARIEHAALACVVQVGGQLQAQARQALIVTGEQFRLDAQQVATSAGLAEVECDLAAQVGQVMADRALLAPAGVAAEAGQQRERQREDDQWTHAGSFDWVVLQVRSIAPGCQG